VSPYATLPPIAPTPKSDDASFSQLVTTPVRGVARGCSHERVRGLGLAGVRAEVVV